MQTDDYQAAATPESLEVQIAAAVDEIKGWSAAAFKSAERQPKDDEFGRRFIEHGAMCYANCALMLQRVLNGASSHLSEAPSEAQ